MLEFILPALLAGLGICLSVAPAGCLVVWRKQAYFSESLAHFSLLSLAFALFFQINPALTLLAGSMVFAVLLLMMQLNNQQLSDNTVLGILAHGSLALGVIIIYWLDLKVDLHAYLFGDILSVPNQTIVLIWIGSIIATILLAINWRKLVMLCIDPELAHASAINVTRIHILFTLLLALIIGFSIKVIGIFLITALLIIPAACARQFSHSPTNMAVLALVIAGLGVIFGILLSSLYNIPTSPAVVALLFATYCTILVVKRLFTNNEQ